MVRQNGLVRLSWLTIILVLVTAGCGDDGREGVSLTATAVPATTTLAVSPLPSDTPLPMLTSTAMPTATPTRTPAPTLTSKEAVEEVRDLLENNAGCSLPCWWGFMPGETEWAEARDVIAPLAFGIYLSGSPNDPVYYFEVYILVPPDVYSGPLIQLYTVRKGVIDMIEVDTTYVPHYSLWRILENYGQPSEVWISTYSEPREGDLPFTAVVFYPEQGFMLAYSYVAEKEGDEIISCLDQYLPPRLALWSPYEYLTFEEAANRTRESGPFQQSNLIELNEAAGMDMATFYEAFRNVDNTTCVETPAELWPSP